MRCCIRPAGAVDVIQRKRTPNENLACVSRYRLLARDQFHPSWLLRLHAQLNVTLLYVTHDRAEASEIGTRIVRMCQGHIERIVSGQEFKTRQQADAR